MVVGITGTDGAGKGTVVEFLKAKGFTHYSSRDFLITEIEKQNLEVNRNQMRLVANELRATYGDEFIARRAYELIDKDDISDAVVESIRAVAEAKYIKERGGVLLAVDADVKIRFKRVQGRRSVSDKVSFEEFVAHEEIEKIDPAPHGMQKAKVIEMADFTIINNGSFKELEKQSEVFLNRFVK